MTGLKCKKCRKEIPEESKFCNHCGAPQKKETMYRRPDGLYEKIITIDGKRVPFRAKTEREVRKKILEYKGKIEEGRPFKEIADDWEKEHFPTLAHNTLAGYIPAKRKAIEFFGDTPIKMINPSDVKKYIGNFPKTWAQKTYKNYFLVLNLIFKYAASNECIESNPAEFVQIPKGLKKSYRRAPTQEEMQIIKNSTEKTFGLFAYFLLYTGCRRGEALALQQKDIDRKSKVIHIKKSIYYDSNAPKIKQPKTEKGLRDIILLDILEQKLPKGYPNDYIFSKNKELLTNSQFEDLWKSYQKETGLKITPHNIRHGYASILHEAGINEKDAQEMLGHANISTTLDIYTHITEKKRIETARKLNEYTQNTQ